MEPTTILVSQLIGNYGITLEDGEKLHDILSPLIAQGTDITLDFSNVTIFASPFFNAAIGRLVSEFSAEQLNTHLHPINLAPAGQNTLKRVIENAKAYQNNPTLRDAIDRVLDEQALTA
ncbi:STAS-like domain-containing protein [Alkalinema pantanalense CENA528]|uniref:STAS-like domain-containing protein n=1 Tax=Alkalinema pantanalense TaxID=1620705 RepID=UPI003D6FDBB5